MSPAAFLSLGGFFIFCFMGLDFLLIYVYFRVPYLSHFLFLLLEPLSFFPSGAYFSLFCLSFSVSDTSAPASLDVQCDRWNMTGEKKESFSSPNEWKGDLQTSEQKREESLFLCAEYSAQQETQHI